MAEVEEIVDVPEAAAVPANWPTHGASPAEALQAQVARDLANDPLAEVCFRAETARAMWPGYQLMTGAAAAASSAGAFSFLAARARPRRIRSAPRSAAVLLRSSMVKRVRCM